MSTARLSQSRLGRMHEILTGYVERGDVPGLVALVSRRGETYVDEIGTSAFGAATPLRRDSIFRISSTSKPITAAATMILVEEGKLRLEEPVDALLPELAERQVLRRSMGRWRKPFPNRPITVRDLLTFRLGFGQMMARMEDYRSRRKPPRSTSEWHLPIHPSSRSRTNGYVDSGGCRSCTSLARSGCTIPDQTCSAC